MVSLKVDVEGEERNLYMDNYLHRQIEDKIKPKIHKKDWDWVWIVDGGEGTGKSVFAQGLAKAVDPTFDVDRMCMTPNGFTKAVLMARKGQCVVFDEAFVGLSSRASLTETNKLIVSLMMEMRQKNLLIIIVMPTFFLLDRYVALFRARGLFHVYLKKGKRGQWIYFNGKKKKLLYLLGKKLLSYANPKSSFKGRFYDQYTVNEEAYREKKKKALFQKSRITKAERFKYHRDILFYILNTKYNLNKTQISLAVKPYFKLARNTISEILTETNKELIKKQVMEEQEESELQKIEDEQLKEKVETK